MKRICIDRSLYTEKDIGKSKVQTAKERLAGANPNTIIKTYEEAITSQNALEIFKGYDIIVDGTDNFPTRYLTNDACVILGKPNVYASIFRFEGQATVFDPKQGGPCYRCLYPRPPPPGLVPSCAEGGVPRRTPRTCRFDSGDRGNQTDTGKGRAACRTALAIRCPDNDVR